MIVPSADAGARRSSSARSASKRTALVTQSEIRVMSIECEKVGGINLAQGVCDTPPPAILRGAVDAAIRNGVNSYTRFDGLAQLRTAIATRVAERAGVVVDPETQVIVSAGSTGAFYCACLALLDPGDEVVVFEPFYGYHISTLLAVEAVPAYVTLRYPDWSFRREDLERAIGPRTKGILVSTPSNPSGKVFSLTELEWVAEIAEQHDLFVFTDEIYEHFVYRGRHVSPVSLPAMADRTIMISGFSKTLSITGWRIGYSVSAAEWAQVIGYMNDLVYVCAPAPLQYAVAVALEELSPEFYRDLVTEYRGKRERLCQALTDVGLPPAVPDGSYYVLADTSRVPGTSSKEKAMHILAATGVASVPGDAFFHGSDGRHLARLCFAKPDDELDEACRRLKQLA